MTLGTEPKKLATLGGLVVVGGAIFYFNVLKTEPGSVAAPPPARKAAVETPAPANIKRARVPVKGAGSQDYKPTLKPRPEDRPDYAKIDPTLRVDLLAKVQAVTPEGGSRSLFQFSAAPAAPKPVEVAAIHPAPRMFGPERAPEPPPPAAPPPPPPPPPITLKFYGYSKPRPDGAKRAFFMDGEEIYVVAEGELVKKRYRLVRIDANSVIMEDTQFKNNRQTLPLTPEAAG